MDVFNNLLTLIPLISSTIGTFLAAYIFTKNIKSTTNRLYLLLGIISSIHCLVEIGFKLGADIQQLEIIRTIRFIWPFNLVAILYFIAALTEKMNWIFRVETFILLISSSLVFTSVNHGSFLVIDNPEVYTRGNSFPFFHTNNYIDVAAQLWILTVGSMIIVAPLLLLKEKEDPRKRGLAKTTTIAHLSALTYFLLSIVSDKTKMEIVFPIPLSLSLSTLLISYAYAMWKYEILILSPVTTAQEIVSTMTDALLLINPDRTISMGNKAATEMFGWSEKEIKEMPLKQIFQEKALTPTWIKNTNQSKKPPKYSNCYIETYLKTKKDNIIPVSLASSSLETESGYMMGYLILARNISERIEKEKELNQYRNKLEQLVNQRTEQLLSSNKKIITETKERKRIEKERASLEEQLQHAQKMDAVGRLAGGIAHDFNNLLFVILGYTEEFINKLDKKDTRMEELEEISEAAKRASYLTKQLLAFSRKQVVTPETIEPEETINRASKMIKRLIGEDIQVEFNTEGKLGYLHMDPGQLDQILVNLTVNARDAMTSGGNLIIKLKKYYINENNNQKHPTGSPGEYILISISDTGHGMSDEIRKKIFEPFFTTKGKGKGTGLGLSMVYGIVRQNSGFIEVKSQPGMGTTFEIYLPKYRDKMNKERNFSFLPSLSKGETILLVEDEDQVRKLASRLLTNRGYVVIEARNAMEAIELFHEKKQQIDLLLTDMVMPDMNGKQLSEKLLDHSPSLKILFMSGYNEQMNNKMEKVDSDTPLLLKPFTSGDLSNKIRKVLDSPERQIVY